MDIGVSSWLFSIIFAKLIAIDRHDANIESNLFVITEDLTEAVAIKIKMNTQPPGSLFSVRMPTASSLIERNLKKRKKAGKDKSIVSPRQKPNGPFEKPNQPLLLKNNSSLKEEFARKYVGISADEFDVTVHSIEPPILTVANFLTNSECASIIASLPLGQLEQSKIGASQVNAEESEINDRRTSSSLLLDQRTNTRFPDLEDSYRAVHRNGQLLFDINGWKETGQLPPPGQYCYEYAQIARYSRGQYFLEHEDAFPFPTARRNKFQRRATLLVYLNSPENGGETKFHHCDLSIKPKEGTALVFFPAFGNGLPDPRTLHSAEPAVDDKWVTQVWLASGL